MKYEKIVYTLLRYSMSFIFLWAFVDKLFGFGFATTSEQSWIHGGSPTSGFLLHGVHGPYAETFHQLANITIIDWTFMAGLLFVGLTLALNKYVNWGALAGSVMLALMYMALIPPANNPIVDEHLVYILVLAVIAIRGGSWKS